MTTLEEVFEAQGIQKGILQGILQGKREGVLEGKREGVLEGKREGRKEAQLELAQELLAQGFPLEKVSQLIKLTPQELKASKLK